MSFPLSELEQTGFQKTWDEHLAAIKAEAMDPRWAQKYALVHIFGTFDQYLFDPVFHAQVEVVMELLGQVDQAVGTASDRER